MNDAKITSEVVGVKFTFGELMKTSGKGEKHTAFIGCWGLRGKAELYLITYDEVVLASDPSTVWSHAEGVVVRFCDVVITAKEPTQ